MNPQNIIYYISFLSFPTLIWFYFLLKKALKNNYKKRKLFFIALIILNLFFIEARFIEPNLITVKKTEIKSSFDLNIALISDIHLWVFKGENFLKRVVEKINKENIDIVIISWDFTYHPNENEIYDLLSPLKEIKVPIYAILWNHDNSKSISDEFILWWKYSFVRPELEEALKKIWINLLNNESLKFRDINIVWIWELYSNEADVEILSKLKKEDKVLTIIHNPDVSDLFVNENSDITLAWHTHWWQIRIPYLYKKIIPTVWDYDKWIYYKKNTTLFISSWLWEIWLPMRFLNPPEIDILKITNNINFY